MGVSDLFRLCPTRKRKMAFKTGFARQILLAMESIQVLVPVWFLTGVRPPGRGEIQSISEYSLSFAPESPTEDRLPKGLWRVVAASRYPGACEREFAIDQDDLSMRFW